MMSPNFSYSHTQLLQFFKNTWLSISTSKYVTLLMVLTIGCMLLANHLTWSTLLLLCWVIGGLSACTLSWLGVQGALVNLLSATFILSLKTLSLWWQSLKGYSSLSVLGDYSYMADSYYLQLTLQLNSYSLSYILLTNLIGLWALLFATNYMRGEPSILNFIMLLYFFLLSMVLLLASGNMPTLMLGWELMGCFSFLLINFWTTSIGTAKSAFKAFLFNKLSDASLMLSFIMLMLFMPNGYTLDFSNLYLLQSTSVVFFGMTLNLLNLFIIGTIICSFCKSAQFGFHAWLPDSMEAPVPASALIHSATLVSAGIFLLGKHEMLTSMSIVNNFLLIWCSFTALYGGLVAAYQTDLKKILAYSTISHCGFLFLLVVYNNFWGLVLYLHLHGWFKSYSFMAAGNVMAKFSGYQDYSSMGGSPYFTTLESLVLALSVTCLGGLPFLLGFFNKHYMLILVTENYHIYSSVFTLAAAFTGLFYSLKTVLNVFFALYKNTSVNYSHNVFGLNQRTSWVSEPFSNIMLLGGYPLAITLLSMIVMSQDYWLDTMIFHSVFGIFFYIVYGVLVSTLFKNSFTAYLVSLLTMKFIYMC